MTCALKRVPLALALSLAAIAHAADLAAALTNVTFPENMAKANGKVYVSTDGAIYALSGSGSNWQSSKAAVTFQNNERADGCTFGGMTAMGQYVYSICTNKAGVHLFVLNSGDRAPAFSEVTLPKESCTSPETRKASRSVAPPMRKGSWPAAVRSVTQSSANSFRRASVREPSGSKARRDSIILMKVSEMSGAFNMGRAT